MVGVGGVEEGINGVYRVKNKAIRKVNKKNGERKRESGWEVRGEEEGRGGGGGRERRRNETVIN